MEATSSSAFERVARLNRSHLPQRRSHEVSSCPFNQSTSNLLGLWLQPSLKPTQPLQLRAPEKSCQAS